MSEYQYIINAFALFGFGAVMVILLDGLKMLFKNVKKYECKCRCKYGGGE